MRSCEGIRNKIGELAALRPAEFPAIVTAHLAECRSCTRALAASRLTRGLLTAAAGSPEPPVDFPDRVLAALPPVPLKGSATTDFWRPAWGLVPAFTATAAALLILYQLSVAPAPLGLVPTEGMSASEQLVIEASPPETDLILAAVMEGDER